MRPRPLWLAATTDRSVAASYASSGIGIVMEMQMGMLDRGADLAWLSQYPNEREILFPPLTGCEVQSVRVEGAVRVVSVRLSVNLTTRTVEQARAARCRVRDPSVRDPSVRDRARRSKHPFGTPALSLPIAALATACSILFPCRCRW